MTPDQARRWESAIMLRRSVRTYDGTPLTPQQAAALHGLQPEPLGPARVRHVLVEGAEATGRIMKGLVGSYGRIIGVPALLVFLAQTDDPAWPACLGYMGHQAVLEATALGLNTCWVKGAFRREAVAEFVPLAGGERPICVSPVGTAAATAGLRKLHDASLKWLTPGRGKRKELAEIVHGEVTANWLRAALEAARWAPSAVNMQPWRFDLAGGQVSLYTPAKLDREGAELDCGIAMANFAVAARAHGSAGRWDLLQGGKEQPLAVWRQQ